MFQRSRSLAIFTLIAVATVSCGDGSSSRNPSAPGPATGSPSAMGGGGMHGPMGPGGGGMGGGASMTVASEFDYLVNMIPHHEEAITTAEILYRTSSRREMRDFATSIIRTQSAEVAQMRAWLAEWYPGRDVAVDYTPMMRNLTGLTGDALDRAFLQDMIPHHMMAVMMSQQLVMRRLAEHDPVIPFATTISETQHAEIRMMRAWLYQWFGE